jgi:hypothetical protein
MIHRNAVAVTASKGTGKWSPSFRKQLPSTPAVDAERKLGKRDQTKALTTFAKNVS